jgi:hypothetical protein
MATDQTSKALLETLISPNESDRNLEAALSDDDVPANQRDLMGVLPHAVRKAWEEMLLNEGLTDAEELVRLRKAPRERKHCGKESGNVAGHGRRAGFFVQVLRSTVRGRR